MATPASDTSAPPASLLRPALLLAALSLLAVPSTASADRARVQSLGGIDLVIEDDSNIYFNPAHIGAYSNRAWFSLGVTGSGGAVGFDPMGGGAVQIKRVFNLGVVLNRSPLQYGFDAALWPVLEAYIPGGFGGVLSGPEGPSETTAPLRFPVDLFVGYGNKDTPVRVGLNVYYAGGANRDYSLDDDNQDGLENTTVEKIQSHLLNVTVGVAGGRTTDRVRPEGWIRMGLGSAWSDRQSFREETTGATPTVDRILSLDRDLRVGVGGRVHIGDPSSLRGIVVSPSLRYDIAGGAMRFDDNLVNPDSDAEEMIRRAMAHAIQVGVGVAGRVDDLRVIGAIALNIDNLNVFDQVNGQGPDIEQTRTDNWDFSLPDLSVGAEYHVLPPLVVRAGVRSTLVAGRTIELEQNFEGSEEDPFQLDANQSIRTKPASMGFEANGGIGLRVRRFSLDATLGGLFLGQGQASFLSRVDMSFSFD
ncbi:MAG: hypothetical protein KDA24_04795 [Deltaproteobacteria bacterium]|nr:hypothetical protein [Deltaproteobacteria bacterium]